MDPVLRCLATFGVEPSSPSSLFSGYSPGRPYTLPYWRGVGFTREAISGRKNPLGGPLLAPRRVFTYLFAFFFAACLTQY